LTFAGGRRRGRRQKTSRLGWRRVASSLIVFALGLGLLGTCPCALADACPATPDRAGRPGPCCEKPSTAAGYHAARCCEEPSRGDVRAVAPMVAVPGPASILDLGTARPVPMLVGGASFSGVPRPLLARVGGPPVLRI